MDTIEKVVRRLGYAIDTLNKWAILLGCVSLVLILGLADYQSGFEFSFSLFYLVPVAITAWFINRNSALFIAGLSSIIWYFSNSLAGQNYSYPIIGLWNAIVRLLYFGIISLLLVDLKKLIQRERDLSNIDFLTGINNSRAFYSQANSELIRAKRYNHPITVAFIDLDNFKQINDNFGHTVGDEVLKIVAKTIRTNLRQTDIVARLGGDEFVIFLPVTDSDPATVSINKIQSLLINSMNENNWEITFSIGAITFHNFSKTIDEMVGMADKLMYSVKGNGKNNIKFAIESLA